MGSIVSATPLHLHALLKAARQSRMGIEYLGQGKYTGADITPMLVQQLDTQLAMLAEAINVACGGVPSIPEAPGPGVPEGSALVRNADTLIVRNAAGVGNYSGTATVLGGVITDVRLPANVAVVSEGFLPVSAQDGTRGNVTIVNGAITTFRLFGKA